MAAPVYLIAINGGLVCQHSGDNVTGNTKNSSRKEQLWVIEQGKDENQVAFRNAANDGYLRVDAGADYTRAKTGSKQWWTLSEGHAPGSCYIRCNDFPTQYLCNAYAKSNDGNPIWTWHADTGWTHALLWYLRDGNAQGFVSSGSSQNAGASGKENADNEGEAAVC